MNRVEDTTAKKSEKVSVWMSVILMKSPPALQREYDRLSGLSHKRGQGKSLLVPVLP